MAIKFSAITVSVMALLWAVIAGATPPGTPLVSEADSLRPDSASAAPLASVPSETTRVEPAPRSVPVFLGGGEVFRVRVGRDGLDPVQRATAVRRRIDEAFRDQRLTADSVHVIASLGGIEVRLGPHFLWLATPADLQIHPAEVGRGVERYTADIREAVRRERARRTPIRILISAAIALTLTLAAWVVFRLLLVGGRRWRGWIVERVAGRLPTIRVRDFEVFSRSQVAGAVTAILGRLHWILIALLLYAYLTSVFSLFPWTQSWSWLLIHFAGVRMIAILSGILSAIPGLAAVAVIMVVFGWLTRLSDALFERMERGESLIAGMHPELARPTKRLVKILLWIVAVMLAYPHVPGSQSKSVQGVSILLGLMVSIGSTGIVGNMISGLVLTYSRAFSPGDRVRIGEYVGDVVGLGFFSTKLRTIRNEEVTLPNGLVTAGAVLNYTRLAGEAGLILYTEVTIGYDAEWRKVHSLLIEAGARVKGIEPEPKPWVNQRSLNDYHISYELNCVTRDSHAQLRLYSDLHAEIQDGFSRAGVEILSPGYHAIRDANAPVLPVEPSGPRDGPGGFRFEQPLRQR